MKCYLVRHGKDDDSVRGGCSDAPLTEQGIEQVNALANDLASNLQLNISRIFSSDLFRAKQTAEIISKAINVPVVYLPQFREVNNGVLAGMKNTEALKKYPGLFGTRTFLWLRILKQDEAVTCKVCGIDFC